MLGILYNVSTFYEFCIFGSRPVIRNTDLHFKGGSSVGTVDAIAPTGFQESPIDAQLLHPKLYMRVDYFQIK